MNKKLIETIEANKRQNSNGGKPKTKQQTADNYHFVGPEKKSKKYDSPGVWFDDGESIFQICSPLEILAETQTETGENYGRLLRWTDSKERVHTYAMPIELIHCESTDLIKYLVSRGLTIGTARKHYEHLRAYINLSNPEKTIISTDKIGWTGGAFVLPDEVFGAVEETTFQSEHTDFNKFGTKGTLDEWRDKVGKFCAGNSRLIFAASAAFACPLLPITEVAGGGFHYRGITSSGKTTALLVAGSVCGGSDEMHGYCQTWKATGNGLEILAANHNHMLLCLDEIGECEAREVGNIAYMLSNGQGKNRMGKNTARRKSYNWHLLFLSSGERKLSEIMAQAGQTIRGGQEIRLCDIEADTGKNGMFENLHGFANGSEFSDYLREISRENYGTAIREFLRRTVKIGREAVRAHWRKFQDEFFAALAITISGKKTGEVMRVASRFALVAFAGEMAAGFGITGWAQGEAVQAAREVFRVWLNGRDGNGNSDAEKAIGRVRYFLEKHGQSRFQLLGEQFNPNEKIIGHAGYKRITSKGESEITEYLISPETFRNEACAGYDLTFVANVLAEKGYLIKANDGKTSRTESVGKSKKRVYVVNSKIFSDESVQKERVTGVTSVT
jgi:putative DNA primase/helicase